MPNQSGQRSNLSLANYEKILMHKVNTNKSPESEYVWNGKNRKTNHLSISNCKRCSSQNGKCACACARVD
eukprot:6462396-Amphidinium_carterae.2